VIIGNDYYLNDTLYPLFNILKPRINNHQHNGLLLTLSISSTADIMLSVVFYLLFKVGTYEGAEIEGREVERERAGPSPPPLDREY
jgi:hypothetical protein